MIRKQENNKILIISHMADCDGMGSVILGIKYFKNIDYILCEASDLECLLKEDFSNYEQIFICDLPLFRETINVIEDNSYLKEHLKHFDHHESSVSDNNHSFVNEVISINGLTVSATYLFYQYLKSLGDKLNKKFYEEFVEGVRAYDIWDKNGDFELGKKITNVFTLMEPVSFIDYICSLDDSKEFMITKEIEDLILSNEKKMNNYFEKAYEKIVITDYKGYKMAVTINEQYRSLLGNYICNKNKDIDFVLIINFERFSCSLRCEKDGVDVSVIASEFQHDGGGHTKSSGFILDSESIPKIKKYVDLYLDNICK